MIKTFYKAKSKLVSSISNKHFYLIDYTIVNDRVYYTSLSYSYFGMYHKSNKRRWCIKHNPMSFMTLDSFNKTYDIVDGFILHKNELDVLR